MGWASTFPILLLMDFYFFSPIFIFFFLTYDKVARAYALSRDLHISKKSVNFAEDLQTECKRNANKNANKMQTTDESGALPISEGRSVCTHVKGAKSRV